MNKLPPFQRFISLILTGENEDKLEKEAFKFKDFFRRKNNWKNSGTCKCPDI